MDAKKKLRLNALGLTIQNSKEKISSLASKLIKKKILKNVKYLCYVWRLNS
jgi:hypothetical protein